MHAIAHGSARTSVRESALKVDQRGIQRISNVFIIWLLFEQPKWDLNSDPVELSEIYSWRPEAHHSTFTSIICLTAPFTRSHAVFAHNKIHPSIPRSTSFPISRQCSSVRKRSAACEAFLSVLHVSRACGTCSLDGLRCERFGADTC